MARCFSLPLTSRLIFGGQSTCPIIRGDNGVTETTFLVRAVIDSCERRGSPISAVRVGPNLGSDLVKLYGEKQSGYQGVKIDGSETLGADVEFYRFPRQQP